MVGFKVLSPSSGLLLGPPTHSIAAIHTATSNEHGQVAVTGTEVQKHIQPSLCPSCLQSTPPPILCLRLPLSVPHHSPCPCFWSSNAGRDNDYKSGMKVSDHNVAHPSQLAFLLPSYDASSWLFLRTHWTAP